MLNSIILSIVGLNVVAPHDGHKTYHLFFVLYLSTSILHRPGTEQAYSPF
jgi:hypothetical protein